jgi:hypothetical protein
LPAACCRTLSPFCLVPNPDNARRVHGKIAYRTQHWSTTNPQLRSTTDSVRVIDQTHRKESAFQHTRIKQRIGAEKGEKKLCNARHNETSHEATRGAWLRRRGGV